MVHIGYCIGNPGSGKVMQKCGLVYEGTLRQSGISNQGLCDEARYALLREDYIEKAPPAGGSWPPQAD